MDSLFCFVEQLEVEWLLKSTSCSSSSISIHRKMRIVVFHLSLIEKRKAMNFCYHFVDFVIYN